ncbi:GNAT family N-acetyltransferase [Bradyrhizobium sp. ISRA443]|uniref:GNAT family N-acetyltransferase n=1 Tax=unclassified Bradyrhizobium TaxID=2631580 RepID=UPI00247A558B|nr:MULTISPECIES: GNAT family N-acetyltransferase [unclassified Bradyrhizobium]WGR93455.1 GNAT family N-acetyltransferase [Bradyrhizobium sp. ISRA435]WGR98004.1 GNAT family N-acetyltransferase [Bradyrhizobium sp. ISRA436]WGS04894.1 GNAT family N-acetyltransferase [Bradyrhizobium sp. ISRA437]WGS11777.1 GNAT family N-acetyltransferase [Bradyrhizobium sp. ISRA443]
MPDIVVTDVIASSIVKAIEEGSDDFIDVITGIGDTHPIAVILKDPETQRVLGGAMGVSSVGLLFLDSFFLPRKFRGRGLGTTILKEFENEGRRRGCRSAFLYTINFPDFYARNGWKVFGRIPSEPPGTFRVFMTKSLEYFHRSSSSKASS